MRCSPRPDDYEARRGHLRTLSDDELHAYFWELVDRIVAPLVEEARTHTTPSIERSVLLRMGFSSTEAADLVRACGDRGLLGEGAGRLVLVASLQRGLAVREAGLAMIDGDLWGDLPT